jgi:hypothetical protein
VPVASGFQPIQWLFRLKLQVVASGGTTRRSSLPCRDRLARVTTPHLPVGDFVGRTEWILWFLRSEECFVGVVAGLQPIRWLFRPSLQGRDPLVATFGSTFRDRTSLVFRDADTERSVEIGRNGGNTMPLAAPK